VAEVLGYARARDAIAQHCKHPEVLKSGESPLLTSSPYGITIIPERDVYRLVMRSKLPAAERVRGSKLVSSLSVACKSFGSNPFYCGMLRDVTPPSLPPRRRASLENGRSTRKWGADSGNVSPLFVPLIGASLMLTFPPALLFILLFTF